MSRERQSLRGVSYAGFREQKQKVLDAPHTHTHKNNRENTLHKALFLSQLSGRLWTVGSTLWSEVLVSSTSNVDSGQLQLPVQFTLHVEVPEASEAHHRTFPLYYRLYYCSLGSRFQNGV